MKELLTEAKMAPRVLRLRNSTFHSARLFLLLIVALLELCYGFSRFFSIHSFFSFPHCPTFHPIIKEHAPRPDTPLESCALPNASTSPPTAFSCVSKIQCHLPINTKLGSARPFHSIFLPRLLYKLHSAERETPTRGPERRVGTEGREGDQPGW